MLTFDDPRWRALLDSFCLSLFRRAPRLRSRDLERSHLAPWPHLHQAPLNGNTARRPEFHRATQARWRGHTGASCAGSALTWTCRAVRNSCIRTSLAPSSWLAITSSAWRKSTTSHSPTSPSRSSRARNDQQSRRAHCQRDDSAAQERAVRMVLRQRPRDVYSRARGDGLALKLDSNEGIDS